MNYFCSYFNEFDKMFLDYFNDVGNDTFIKNGKLKCNVAGFNEDNLNVEFGNNTIFINGENDFGQKIDYEFKTTTFTKKPKSANIKDGILTIEFEKPEEQKRISLIEK